MRTIDSLRRSAVAVRPSQTLLEVAAIMDEWGVGTVAVVDGDRLTGIVTDRDLVRRAMARGLSLEARADAVMSCPVVTIDADADLHDAFALFRTHAVRRLAVVRGEEFAGIVSVDDLLIDLSADLADLVRPVATEVLFAHRDSPVPATT